MEPFTMMFLYVGYRLAKVMFENIDSIVETAQLAWNTVKSWLSARFTGEHDIGNLVKERMANGSFRVVAGVFNSGTMRERTAWECKDMDTDLLKQFGSKDCVEVRL